MRIAFAWVCAAFLASPCVIAAPLGWDVLNFPPSSGMTSFQAAGEGTSILFVNSFPNAMRSSDGGATWKALPGSTSSYNGFGQPAVFPAAGQPNSVYRLTHVYDSGTFTDHQFLWFSSDAGETWNQVSEIKAPAPYYGFGTLAPIGSQPGLVIAELTADRGGFTGYTIWPVALARSTDGGRTWAVIDGTSAPGIYYVGLSSSTYNRRGLYLADNGKGILRSLDSGATWQSVTIAGNVDGLWVDALNASLVYARWSGKLWASDDAGLNWREVPTPDYTDNSSDYNAFTLAVDPDQEGRVYALSRSAGLFASSDAARSWQRVTVTGNYRVRTIAQVARRNGKRSMLSISDEGILSRDLDAAPRGMALGTDLWWNPAESGWGLSITQHESLQMFAVWFTYDELGKPTWRFIPGGQWVDATTFVGQLCMSRKPPQSVLGSFGFPPTVTVVGTATLKFTDGNNGSAEFAFTGGPSVRLPIQRMTFGAPAPQAPWPADLYFNKSQPGWGLGVHQQYRNYFVTWFLYDEAGAPTWLFVPDARIPTASTPPIIGDIYRASSAAGAAYAARSVTVTKVGSIVVGVNSREAVAQGIRSSFNYTIEGMKGGEDLDAMEF